MTSYQYFSINETTQSSFIETNVFNSFHLLSFAPLLLVIARIVMAVNRCIGIGIEWLLLLR